MTGPTCPTHKRALVCPTCSGTKGGLARGGRKATVARANMARALDKRWGAWKSRAPAAPQWRCPRCETRSDGPGWCYCAPATPTKRTAL